MGWYREVKVKQLATHVDWALLASRALLVRQRCELAEPVIDFSGQMNYCEMQKLFDAIIPFGQYRCYWKSHCLSALPDGAIEQIVAGNAAPLSPNPLSSIWNFSGATARVAADAPTADGAVRRGSPGCCKNPARAFSIDVHHELLAGPRVGRRDQSEVHHLAAMRVPTVRGVFEAILLPADL